MRVLSGRIGPWWIGRLAGVAMGLLGGGGMARGGGDSGVGAFDYVRDLKPFVMDYCIACHGKERPRAQIDLESVPPAGIVLSNRDVWDKVRHVIESREMPPENRRQPSEFDRQATARLIGDELERLEAALPPTAGLVTLRRLNRNEYRNTIRDLLGVDYEVHGEFPHDESGYGFDNIGDVLSLPPMLFEKYLAAAEEIARRTIVTEDPARQRVKRLPAGAFSTEADAISTLEEEIWGFYREGEIVTVHAFAKAGDYILRLGAYGEQAGSELPKMGVGLGGREIHVQSVRALEGRPETFEVPIRIEEAGPQRLSVSYLNNFNTDGDRNVFMTSFEVLGPLGAEEESYPESHRRVLPRRPLAGEEATVAAEALRSLVSRAYRRPAKDEEVRRLVGLVEQVRKDGASFEEGMRLALQAVLVSPHFLYRWELDPEPLGPGEERALNDYEVASRLSYFLWSSMPDDALLAVAAEGRLTEPDVLVRETKRMLRDPKARALVEHFGGQWLQIRNLEEAEPDPLIFPGWGPELREAMKAEAEMFLWALIQEDRPIQSLLDADFTYLNERLARHYGMEGVEGEAFRRVTLPAGSARGGVLTMGSVLTVTSVPTRTAPVLRGKWILEQILGTPPPPPPPDVPAIEEGEEASKTATLRQRLELHRSKPECMTCHQRMDPLGFALENFDAVGAWREMDGVHPIDNTAELPGGRTFVGAAGLKEVLRSNEEFPRALTSKLLTYALGRGLQVYDRRAVRGILENLEKNGFKFSSLVLEVVASDPFLKRQPEPAIHDQHASLHP
ncbi:MAG: DUF1592 domain-containing protein [Verrucomicrobiae bacterium]|nr:DUF1592 domain-containing protein [Verrucomicrobiae bacterium]